VRRSLQELPLASFTSVVSRLRDGFVCEAASMNVAALTCISSVFGGGVPGKEVGWEQQALGVGLLGMYKV
jgi:hypothetical protein